MTRRSDHVRRGFSLVELLLAIFILGVGIISVAAIFPAGIAQQQQSRDDLMGPIVAAQAMSTIRSKIGQEDFGTFEQFGLSAWEPRTHLDSDARSTIPGDWGWMRPSFLLDSAGVAIGIPPGVNPNPGPLHGAIDIFGLRRTRANEFGSSAALPDYLSEDDDYMTTSDMAIAPSPSGPGNVNGLVEIAPGRPHRSTDPLFSPYNTLDEPQSLWGIPYNRSKYLVLSDFDPPASTGTQPPDYRMNPARQGRGEPLVTLTQGDRAWPQGTERAEYYWDCLFRRYQGRIQVAIFVYRVGFGGQGARPYAVASHTGPLPADADQTPLLPSESPMPARVDFRTADDTRWYPTGLDAGSALDDPIVPGTFPSSGVLNEGLDPYKEGWQYPGQWILDQNGNVHRVLKGRRSRADGPVQLTHAVPYIPRQASSGNLFNAQGNPIVDPAEASAVKSIWFIPPETRNGVFLTPVFVMVKDL